MGRREELIVGLDLGTTKICAVVGEVTSEGIDIVGVGTYPSIGLRGGVVVNIDQTVQSIRKAVEEAELMAGCEISSVYAGVAGTHVQSLNSHGVIAVKSREVTQADIDRVLDAAKTIALPYDRQILHVLPQQFLVDDQEGIQNPTGMAGVRLEAKVHIITGAVSAVQNIIKCCERAGLQVQDVVLESLASSESVLDTDEKHLGVALVDIGGGTSDVAVFLDHAIRYSCVVGLGGSHITSDISVGLRTSMEEAEKIKKKYGCALVDRINQQEMIEVGSVGGQKPRQLAQSILTQIIEARVEEIIKIIEWELVRSGFMESLHAGMVLTGGVSLLPGIREVAERIFDMPVRIGVPFHFGGLGDVVKNPMYATATGLLAYGRKHGKSRGPIDEDSNLVSKVLTMMKRWFREFW
ncbi:cell division protein FtsA [Desulforhabdus amnigena]|jgi:cell division protein FtsA|uniref:Cell division protein FtsA n=1 Tax=Desulforhabdus amnigena TaxID=40218 RepID=A0A9W6LAQ6_9BACT|nr:cell division protein FtsA [Desulforhabdus amnigena]NLJ26741.1 cell division protein FtsA [Deltaproteobacteria bacterium]GLI36001.1 cell division protein FtsA [Desulforhabdus amnigena]